MLSKAPRRQCLSTFLTLKAELCLSLSSEVILSMKYTSVVVQQQNLENEVLLFSLNIIIKIPIY